jgi:predicted phosphate transport protein (TIGR00153 family)
MAFSLMPKEEKFFDMFESQAEHMVQTAKVFKDLIAHWNVDSELVAKVRELEHEADIITHEMMDKLNRTFITPFDREDIHVLAKETDDVIDLIHSATNRMHLFKIPKMTEELEQMADVLLQATEALKKALGGLRDLGRPRRILDYCIEINRLENQGDRVLEMALGRLFDRKPDPIEVIKWKEIYEIVEFAIDKCEDVANTIESIVVKQG